MVRENLRKELSNLLKRYRLSTSSLERFVEHSREDINRKLAERFNAMEKVGDKGIPASGLGVSPDHLSDNTWRAIVEAMSESCRIVEPHPQMLMEMSLTYAGAIFDAFISDALFAVLRHVPEILRSGRTLTIEEALRFQNRGELIADLARREVRDLMYKSVEKQLDYFHSSFGVDISADERWMFSIEDLAAVRERRNLVAHNNGLVNAEYVARFDSSISVGDRVVTDAERTTSDRALLFRVGTALVSSLRHELTSITS